MLSYLVLIHLKPGQQERLREYECGALAVFRRHGGSFERILRPIRTGDGLHPQAPDEIHLLRFETADGLEAARQDPEMTALRPLREEIVERVLLIPVEDVQLDAYFTLGG